VQPQRLERLLHPHKNKTTTTAFLSFGCVVVMGLMMMRQRSYYIDSFF